MRGWMMSLLVNTHNMTKKPCEVCGKEVKKIRQADAARFCSRECYWSTIRGIASPFWKHGNYYTKEYKAYHSQIRRARKRSNGGSFTLEQWQDLKKKYDYMCLCCKEQEPDIKLTIDHIIPVSKGGLNTIENIQPLCLSCNSRKQDRIKSYLFRTHGRFIRV